MEEKLSKRLMWFYYLCYTLAVLAATLMWFLVTKEKITAFSPQSAVGNVVQYIVIVYTLVSVPGGLYGFKLKCNQIKRMEQPAKYAAYYKWAAARICVVGVGITFGVVAFYLLLGYQSMLWCAAISAVGLFFCKPVPRKIQLELTDDEHD
ncbi:MAG TPA: hypothetical protein DIW30_03370 [Bacteroidales bacterium]|nr:hypothetical protein [Bacteroidales bacterium]